MFKTRRKGFTLVELMIVLAIIAIVAAFAIPNLMKSRMAANETAAIGALRTIMAAEGTSVPADSNEVPATDVGQVRAPDGTASASSSGSGDPSPRKARRATRNGGGEVDSGHRRIHQRMARTGAASVGHPRCRSGRANGVRAALGLGARDHRRDHPR